MSRLEPIMPHYKRTSACAPLGGGRSELQHFRVVDAPHHFEGGLFARARPLRMPRTDSGCRGGKLDTGIEHPRRSSSAACLVVELASGDVSEKHGGLCHGRRSDAR